MDSLHDLQIVCIDSRNGGLKLISANEKSEKILEFSSPLAYRVTDYSDQNIISRFIEIQSSSTSLVECWVSWIFSDSNGSELASEEGKRKVIDEIHRGKMHLYVIEPSWGAEIAVIASSVAISEQAQA